MSYSVEGMMGNMPRADRIILLDEITLLLDEHRLANDFHITFVVTNRLTKAAGNCLVSQDRYDRRKIKGCRIALSAHYYREFGIQRTIGTLRHEIAHLMDCMMTGKMSHSANFKRICVRLGGTMNTKMAGTTHSASGTKEYINKPKPVRKFKYVYTCLCGAKFERKIRAKRTLRLNHNAVCTKCKTPLPLWKELRVAI